MINKNQVAYKLTQCLAVPFVLSLSLSACDSSSSSDDNNSDTDVLTGRISGVSIEGLSYQTASQSGITTAENTFSYKAGESFPKWF